MDELLADFLTEVSENLAELDMVLLSLEKNPKDGAAVQLIFRLVHTLKGTCGFLGLSRLEKISHRTENVLGQIRDGKLKVTSDIISLILSALDKIRSIIDEIAATGSEPEGDDNALFEALDKACVNKDEEAKPENTASSETAPPEEEKPPTATEAALSGELPEQISEVTAEASSEDQISEDEESAKEDSSAEEAAETDTPPDDSSDALENPSAASVAENKHTPAKTGGAAEAIHPTQSIRVSVSVLEELMTMIGELVLNRNQLLQLAKKDEYLAFTTPLQRLSQITGDLQEGVVKARMQPIGNAWNKFPRIVRDIAENLHKEISLDLEGADTEVDRQVLEFIRDPLTHMVRNSADHGIELPEDRLKAGKTREGHISLRAWHEGGHIFIEISDDGRGLDLNRIRKKAASLNLYPESTLKAMSDSEVMQIIFMPGFSTAGQVTSISGRGVGMDVVKSNIEKISGLIDVQSVFGKYTTFTIKIPLTLAIVSALIVEAGKERFAIPQTSVLELIRTQGNNALPLETINNSPVLRLRSELIPVFYLTEILQMHQRQDAKAADQDPADATQDLKTDSSQDQIVIIAQAGGSNFGIIIDRFFDTEEIVVKPLSSVLSHKTHLFGGQTILGDGSVVMILNPSGVAKKYNLQRIIAQTNFEPDKKFFEDDSNNPITLLLFKAGNGVLKAVPLALVARLETFALEKIEFSNNWPVIQYRDHLVPLIGFDDNFKLERPLQPTLIFIDSGRIMGLMVDEIIDVVDTKLSIDLNHSTPTLLGSAIIDGQTVDIIDAGYWLHKIFKTTQRPSENFVNLAQKSVLLVEDSYFFRHLLLPKLSAAGFLVTAVENPILALKKREEGTMFDLIISDIEMPEMNGFDFVKKVRHEGIWKDLPVIALSSHTESQIKSAALDAGFTLYLPKFDYESLLNSASKLLEEKQQQNKPVLSSFTLTRKAPFHVG